MLRRDVQVRAGLWLLLCLPGCAHVMQAPPPGRTPADRSALPEDLPVCLRKDVTVDVAGPLSRGGMPERPGQPKELPPYHALGDQECLCRAVAASTMGNLKDLEQQVISAGEEKDRQKCKDGESPEAQLQHTILYYLMLEDRNRSGADALAKYYELGAAEGQSDIVEKSFKSADSTLAKAKSLKAQGLEVAVDDAKLNGQKLALEAQRERVRLNIEQLNSDLRVALGFCPAEAEWRFWPSDAFQAGDEQVSIATAVAVGVANRPELVLLRYLENELNSDNQGAAIQMLRGLSGALGMTKSPGKCPMLSALLACLCKSGDDDTREVELRRAQLHEYHVRREREVVEQIGQAVRTIAAETEILELARQETKSWEQKVNQAKDKEQNSIGLFAETSAAEGEWLKAQGKVIEETANLLRARVLLHHAQGILPAECIPPAGAH
jgi:hypothetical protein